MKEFAPNILVGYSSGTGFAGGFGAGITLILTIFNFQDYSIFLGCLIIPFIYFLSFYLLNKRKLTIISDES